MVVERDFSKLYGYLQVASACRDVVLCSWCLVPSWTWGGGGWTGEDPVLSVIPNRLWGSAAWPWYHRPELCSVGSKAWADLYLNCQDVADCSWCKPGGIQHSKNISGLGGKEQDFSICCGEKSKIGLLYANRMLFALLALSPRDFRETRVPSSLWWSLPKRKAMCHPLKSSKFIFEAQTQFSCLENLLKYSDAKISRWHINSCSDTHSRYFQSPRLCFFSGISGLFTIVFNSSDIGSLIQPAFPEPTGTNPPTSAEPTAMCCLRELLGRKIYNHSGCPWKALAVLQKTCDTGEKTNPAACQIRPIPNQGMHV